MNDTSTSLFFAAHSPTPSGSTLQDYLVGNKTLAQKTSGLILLGSFLKRSYRSASSFPIPTLTIGAELDGVCRITRIMEEYVHRVMMVDSPSQTIKTSPVTVVQGMTHMQFASGSPSDSINKYDLKPEREDSDVQSAVSFIVSSFVAGTALGNETSLANLGSAVQDAGKFFQPLVDAYWLEGSYKFKAPCYESTPNPACQVGSWWTRRAVVALSDLKDIKVNDTDSFHPASEVIPTYHHPMITSQNCPTPDASLVQ